MFGCVSNTKYEQALSTIDSLNNENQKLILENDELLNGEDRLINYIKMHNDKGNFILAEENICKLQLKHPESQYIESNKNLFIEISKKAKLQKDSVEKHIRDSIRLANIDKLGEWKIGDYVDDFGNPTGRHFVELEIDGFFSNSATSSSKLSIRFRIKGKVPSDEVNAFGNYYYEFYFDEYANGVRDKYYGPYHTKITKRENHETTMICGFSVKGYNAGMCNCKMPNGEKEDYHIVDLLKEEGTYSFDVTAENNTDYADTKYYFTINSKYLSNALLKAGIDTLD